MSSDDRKTGGGSRMKELAVYQSYRRSKYLSIKHSSYFQVYEELLNRYRNKPITFVEIGVYNGGSLFMWRDYFGPEVRIVGVDLNPMAKQWEKDGFEIKIGNQADPNFWNKFFADVGDVDVILDDGGHTCEQQIVTAHKSIPHIRDGGILVVEDTHTNYSREFGYPSRYSFISYSKALIDGINSRFPSVKASANALKDIVWSMGFYESIVCFHVDRSKCFVSSPTTNEGISFDAQDFRHHQTSVGRIADVENAVARALAFLKNATLFKSASSKLFKATKIILVRWQLRRLQKYFG
jgi:hypothetical protein